MTNARCRDHGRGAPCFCRSTTYAGRVTALAIDALLDGLNPEQRAAVVHQGGPLLIVAGAGSGKTRVLTHRIAYLLAARGVAPHEILAITFTNKAAGEMASRVAALVGPRSRAMWVMTFHSACVRILRREAKRFGYPSSFSVYDQADSQRLMALTCRELELDAKQYPPKALAAQVSNLKNELIDHETFAARAKTARDKALAEAYAEYQRRLHAAGAMDFDDLIMVTVNIFQALPEVAAEYRRRFRHVLVDEYQDTNHAQYVLVRELVSGSAPLFPAERSIAPRGPSCTPGAVRRRRRGPVDLRLPRRHDPQHRRVRAGLSGREGHPARAELPLHAEHPGRRQRRGLAEPEQEAQEPLVRRGRGPADRRLRGRQRARRGRVRGRGGGPAGRRGRGDARPGGGLLPDERPVPGLRGGVHQGRAALPRGGRGPVLRTPRGPRSARLPAADRQPGGRGVPAAGAERAQARHRRPRRGVRGRLRAARADHVRAGAGPPGQCPGLAARSAAAIEGFNALIDEFRELAEPARWPSWPRPCSTAPGTPSRWSPHPTCRTPAGWRT